MRLLYCLVIYILISSYNYAYSGAEDIREYIEKDIAALSSIPLDSDKYISELHRLQRLCQNNFDAIDTTTSKVYALFHKYYLNRKSFSEASEFQKLELQILIEENDSKKLADAYTELGQTYGWLSEFYESEKYYLKGLDIKKQILDHTFFENYIGLCLAYSQQGKYNLHKEYAKRAQEVAKTPKQNCQAYFELLRVHIYLNQYEEARLMADEMLTIARRENLSYCIGRAYTGRGWIIIEEQDALKKRNRSAVRYNDALKSYLTGIEYIENSDNNYKQRTLAYNYSDLSNIYARLKQYEKSIKYGNQAIKISQEFYNKKHHQDTGTLFANLAAKYGGRYAIERKKILNQNLPVSECKTCFSDINNTIKYHYEAIKCFLQKDGAEGEVLDYSKQDMYGVNLKKRCITSITNLARAYALKYYYHNRNEEDLQSAEKNISLAVDLIDIMRSEMSSKETKMLWRRLTKSRYDDGVAIAEWMSDANKMLYYMEKSKSILLLEELNHQEALTLIPEHVSRREELLRKTISDNPNKTPQDYNVYNSFLDSIKHEYPAYYEYKFDISPPTIAEVQDDILSDSTAIIAYYTTSDSLYTVNITKDQSEVLTQSSDGLDEDISALLGYLNNKDSLEFQQTYDRFLEVSLGLYKRLYAPITQKRKHSIIVSDGMIEYLPFDVLVDRIDDQGKPHYLIDDHVFSNTSSISVLQKKRIRTQNNFDNMLMVCPQRFDSLGLPPLLYSEREIDLLGNIINTEVLKDEDASLNSFIEKSEDYDVLHLSSHSGLDEETNQPWIAFQDSLINLNEIYKLKLNSSLVCLSSCKSFDGDYNTQEGINSLARAFLFTDVSAVVGSMWNLNEASGLKIFEEFYTNLKKSNTKSAALRDAKLKFIKDNPHKSPYHWAPLVIIGSPDGLSQSKAKISAPNILYLLGVSSFIFLLVYLVKRKIQS